MQTKSSFFSAINYSFSASVPDRKKLKFAGKLFSWTFTRRHTVVVVVVLMGNSKVTNFKADQGTLRKVLHLSKCLTVVYFGFADQL